MESSNVNLENPVVFYDRFTRGRNLLRDMAIRVLGSAEHVEEAVRKCFATASQNPPKFKSEDAFYCWLVRILIAEASLILDQEQTPTIPSIPVRNEAHGTARTQ